MVISTPDLFKELERFAREELDVVLDEEGLTEDVRKVEIVSNITAKLMSILDLTVTEALTAATVIFVKTNSVCGEDLAKAVNRLRDHVELWERLKKDG